MLRIDRSGRRFTRLAEPELAEREIWERQDLQQMVCNSPEQFFAELGERLLLIGQELCPTDVVDDRIDLLAIDTDGTTVILELKRGNHKLQLLQAISYAGMVSKWDGEELVATLADHAALSKDDAREQIGEFLGSGTLGDLNASQRIVLIAEHFDYTVLAAAQWLTEKYDVDIKCFRVQLSQDGDTLFLSCACVYPPADLSTVAVRRRRAAAEGKPAKWANWDEALAAIHNTAVVDFFKRRLTSGTRASLNSRVLRFRGGGVRLGVVARRARAYVWQRPRFKGDMEFWRTRLDAQADVAEVRGGEALSFVLTTPADFRSFEDVVERQLSGVEVLESAEDEPGSDE